MDASRRSGEALAAGRLHGYGRYAQKSDNPAKLYVELRHSGGGRVAYAQISDMPIVAAKQDRVLARRLQRLWLVLLIELAQEAQELLVPMPREAGATDLPGDHAIGCASWLPKDSND